MKFTTAAIAFLFSHIFSISTITAAAAPTAAAAVEGKQIRGVTEPVYHLYLQKNAQGVPVLGAEVSAGNFTIDGSIQDVSSKLYLNIDATASTSYKNITFGETAETMGWGLEGDTVITTTASSFGRQLNFLACESSTGDYGLYLQTGGDLPEGESCTSQTLHLPCLC